MSLVNLQNAPTHKFMENMELIKEICSPTSEIGIAEIIAAKALLKLKDSGTRCHSQADAGLDNGLDFKEPPAPLDQSRLTENIENVGSHEHESEMSAGTSQSSTSAGYLDSDGCKISTTVKRTPRRKRTRASTSGSSDQSIAESPTRTSNNITNTKKTCKKNMIAIGDGNAIVPKKILSIIKWDSYTNATRKLLTAVFSRQVLATHSLTGRQSPAFPDKAAKQQLDSKLVKDIVKTVVARCGVSQSLVRTVITTKCADESKMRRNIKQMMFPQQNKAAK